MNQQEVLDDLGLLRPRKPDEFVDAYRRLKLLIANAERAKERLAGATTKRTRKNIRTNQNRTPERIEGSPPENEIS